MEHFSNELGNNDLGNSELDTLFSNYKSAVPDPDPSANFMPELWRKIESRQTLVLRIRRLTQVFVAAALAICVVFAMLLAVPRPDSPTFTGTYVDDLPNVVDIARIRDAGIRIGADPLGGASVAYWAEIADRHGHVRHALGGVDADEHVTSVGGLDDRAQWHHGAEHVGLVTEAEKPRRRGEQLVEVGEVEAAVVVDAKKRQLQPGAFSGELPRNKVAVMLHLREQNPVTRAEELTREGRGHQVEGLGGVAHEDDSLGGGIDEPCHALARALEDIGRLVAKRVHPPMHVGVVLGVVGVHGIEDHLGLL